MSELGVGHGELGSDQPRQRTQLPEKRPRRHFVQTERAAHEKWAALGVKHPAASALFCTEPESTPHGTETPKFVSAGPKAGSAAFRSRNRPGVAKPRSGRNDRRTSRQTTRVSTIKSLRIDQRRRRSIARPPYDVILPLGGTDPYQVKLPIADAVERRRRTGHNRQACDGF